MSEQDPKNTFEKLQNMRVKLQKLGLKKTGMNKHTQARYWELSDFLPYVNLIMIEEGLTSQFTINQNGPQAVLEILNTNIHFDSISMSIPFVVEHAKGMTAPQALGAAITYARRYLWMMALELTESDVLDSLPADASEEIETSIMSAGNIEDLKRVYLSAMKSHPKMAEQIKSWKDQRKSELEVAKNEAKI